VPPRRSWSPTRAGVIAIAAICVLGIAVAVAATASITDPAERQARTRRYGSYAGIVAALAGAGAYAGQAWRGKR
jgi:hypothetical protein